MNKNKIKHRGRAWLCLLLVPVLLCALMLPISAAGEQNRIKLYVGGTPFGVRYFTDGIMVVGYCDVSCGTRAQNPARAAGVRPGDCIVSVDGKTPDDVSDLAEMIHQTSGKPMMLALRREGEELTVSLSPLACDSDGRYRTGLWVRDSGAGIGTVTYIAENGKDFAGLGHGICDGSSGCLVPIARGTVMGVEIGGIKKGAIGAPGELQGHFSAGKTGVLTTNTPCGVFGVLSEHREETAALLPIGFRDELHEGDATCRCTLDDGTPQEYSIKISDIHRTARDNKCFTVTVTDAALLAKTGGIVQGMSGSPIIQNGKLVGAITHVLIGDPTTGYGIFIENMLNAAQMPMARAS